MAKRKRKEEKGEKACQRKKRVQLVFNGKFSSECSAKFHLLTTNSIFKKGEKLQESAKVQNVVF